MIYSTRVGLFDKLTARPAGAVRTNSALELLKLLFQPKAVYPSGWPTCHRGVRAL